MHAIAKLGVVLLALSCCETDDPTGENEPDAPLQGECGDLSCQSGLYVSLVAQGRTFAPGTYTVAFDLGEGPRSCGFTLMADAMACGGDALCVSQSDCDANFNLAILPHTIGFSVATLAEYVEVQVRRDEGPIVTTGFAPMYDIYFPNGSDCEPACSLAQVELAVP